MSRIVRFAQLATEEAGGTWTAKGNGTYEFRGKDGRWTRSFTDNRDDSLEQEHLQLLGLDHSLVLEYLERYRNVAPAELGVRVRSATQQSGVVATWEVATQGSRGETRSSVISIGIGTDCSRVPTWERSIDQLYQLEPAGNSAGTPSELLLEILEAKLQRELVHRKIVSSRGGYDARLIGWLEMVGTESWEASNLTQVVEDMREAIETESVSIAKAEDCSIDAVSIKNTLPHYTVIRPATRIAASIVAIAPRASASTTAPPLGTAIAAWRAAIRQPPPSRRATP